MVSCQVATTARPIQPARERRRLVRLADQRAAGSVEFDRIPSFIRPLVPLADQQAEEWVDSARFRVPVRPLVRQANRRWYETG